MLPYQREFIAFAIANDVLRFGSFKLKSGRISPYFFNAGLFNTGKALAAIGRFYAAALRDPATPAYDLLFGPAYKGIPIAVTTAVALAEHHDIDVPVTFNRKEAKDHGEGGTLVGAPMKDRRVIVLDDVITAGTAIRESVAILNAAGAKLAGVVVAIDRQEKGAAPEARTSAIEEVEKEYGITVRAVVTLSDVVDYLKSVEGYESAIADIEKYRSEYGTASS